MQVKLVSWTAWGSLSAKLNALQKDGSGHILLEVETGTKVGELMEQLGIPKGCMIAVNDELLTADHVLQPNDRVGLFEPAGGG